MRAPFARSTPPTQSLKSATAKGDVQSLEEALKEGRKVLLEEEDDDGTRFLCPEVMEQILCCNGQYIPGSPSTDELLPIIYTTISTHPRREWYELLP